MIVTEAQASEKWCPQARVGGPMHSEAQSTSYNRWPGSDGTATAMLDATPTARCIGAMCMAWRWVRTHVKDPAGGPDLVPATRTYGFCGAFGCPPDWERGARDAFEVAP